MIRCIVIDDEPLALDLMEDFIGKVPFLNLVAKCKSAINAIELLQKEQIELIFLDIQMPDLTGIQFLKSLKHKPMVIFTTAYQQYALEGYELDVLDYLLKPFTFERFLKAVNKASEYQLLRNASGNSADDAVSSKPDFIFVKADYQSIRINLKDILYIEGLKDYIKIYLCDRPRPVLTLMTLKSMEDLLPESGFIRVHKSFIVPMARISSWTKSYVKIEEKEIPIGQSYLKTLEGKINPNT
jgi:DNA-binding LytR/AlgR family response regulator